MKRLISLRAIVLLLAACTKNSNNKEVTVTGRLMQSCDTPAANKDGIIYLSGGGLLNNPSTSLEFTTDENGYFKVIHDKSFSEFSVRTSANHSVLEANISGDEKELGDVYINPFPTNFVIKLDVKNPYTENDTLVLLDFSDPDPFAQQLIAGPFQSGLIDSVKNFNFNIFPLKWTEIKNNEGPRGGVQYRIRSLPDYIGSNKHKYFYHSLICSGNFAEVTLVIE